MAASDPAEEPDKCIASRRRLYLGTECFVTSIHKLGITHRLSCLMTHEEEKQWMEYADMDQSEITSLPVFQTSNTVEEQRSDGEGGRISVCRCPMADEDLFGSLAKDFFNQGSAFIDESLRSSDTACVYVHCSHGVSRSPTMVMWYLMKYCNFSALQAAKHVKARRVKVSPTDNFISLLLDLEVELNLDQKSEKEEVFTELRRGWLSDFKAGKVKLSQYNCIL